MERIGRRPAQLARLGREGRVRLQGLAKKASTKKKTTSKKKKVSKAPASRAASRASAEPGKLPAAVKAFQEALAPFHKRDFAKTVSGLKSLMAEFPSDHDILDRARTYIRICERELDDSERKPRSVEEKFALGVVRLNAGELDGAAELFEACLKSDKASDRAEYALAAVHALAGRSSEALERLKKAVELNSENRIFAAQDPDLESLRDEIEFQELIGRRGARP